MEQRDESRIIFTYGVDTVAKISKLKVLIVGLRGVGAYNKSIDWI